MLSTKLGSLAQGPAPPLDAELDELPFPPSLEVPPEPVEVLSKLGKQATRLSEAKIGEQDLMDNSWRIPIPGDLQWVAKSSGVSQGSQYDADGQAGE